MPRADARRNRERLLSVAGELLVEHGSEIPLEEVARRAGCGKGTLYRHFPTREHLLAALLRERFDELAESAEQLRGEVPWRAVEIWLAEFALLPSGLRGLGARLATTLGDDDSAVGRACLPMKAAFARLVLAAQAAGDLRPDVVTEDILSVVAALPEHLRTGTAGDLYLDVVLTGLRSTAATADAGMSRSSGSVEG